MKKIIIKINIPVIINVIIIVLAGLFILNVKSTDTLIVGLLILSIASSTNAFQYNHEKESSNDEINMMLGQMARTIEFYGTQTQALMKLCEENNIDYKEKLEEIEKEFNVTDSNKDDNENV